MRGIHGAGDNSHKDWDWYVKSIIGTNFIGHPMDPQFQKATMRIEDKAHPATAQMMIMNPLAGGGIANLFSTHPATEDRVARLRQLARG